MTALKGKHLYEKAHSDREWAKGNEKSIYTRKAHDQSQALRNIRQAIVDALGMYSDDVTMPDEVAPGVQILDYIDHWIDPAAPDDQTAWRTPGAATGRKGV